MKLTIKSIILISGILLSVRKAVAQVRVNMAREIKYAVKQYQGMLITHSDCSKLYCPFGYIYRLTKKEAYKTIMLKVANSLATSFNPSYGVIKSWDI